MADRQFQNSKHLFSIEVEGSDNQLKNSEELPHENLFHELTPTVFSILEAMYNDLQDIKKLLKKQLISERSSENVASKEHHIDSNGERDLRIEFAKMIRVIVKTKTELAQLSPKDGQSNQIKSASSELDTVVQETEHATQTILQATESIAQSILLINNNIDRPDFYHELKHCSQEINKNITKIIESCNFQDITGQRVRKVVRTMHFIEERVRSMVDIWGGAQAFANIPVPTSPDESQEDGLLQGPQLANQGVTQDEIDQLFQ